MEQETQQCDIKERSAERLATASFVLGIISLFSILCCCPFVFSAIGIGLALLSKGAEKALRPKAKTGLILSIVGMVVSFVLIVFTLAFPYVMYKTNPEFRKNFKSSMEQALDEQEDFYRQMYGDETYEQIRDMLINGEGPFSEGGNL